MRRQINSYKPLAYATLYAFTAWLLVYFLARWNEFTQNLYPNFYAWFQPAYSKLFGFVPFSVGDLLYGFLVLILIISFSVLIRCFALEQKWRGIRVVSRLIKTFAMLYVVFHLLWGFNYYKPNLSESLNGKDYTNEELKFIANDCLEKSIALREDLDENKNKVFHFERYQFYQNLPSFLNLNISSLQYAETPKSSLKKYSLYSLFMRYFGISGYFNPFTSEAQVTRLTPSTSMPFSMAHEQAHQMGYATEYEANFIGYLTCIQSKDKALAYSANFKALNYVLREIYPRDSAFVYQKLNEFSPGMQRDYEAEKEFNEKYRGRSNEMFSAMNHLYLKANNQKEGIESYNRFVELLVGYYRTEME